MSASYVISVSMGTGCYRHLRVDGSATLCDLSEVILDAFDFFDDHLHAFFMNNHAWSEGPDVYYSPYAEDEDQFSDEVTLDELSLTPGKRFLFIFDFGDDWRFSCRVLRVLDEPTDEPEIVRSVGEAPDQYPDCDKWYDDWDDEDDDDDDDEPVEIIDPRNSSRT